MLKLEKPWTLFGFYGSFKNNALISSRSLIRGGRKSHLTYRCSIWHLACVGKPWNCIIIDFTFGGLLVAHPAKYQGENEV